MKPIFPEVQVANELPNTNNDMERTILFDYNTNKFVFESGTPKEASRVDALKQWVELFVRTELNKYAIYSDSFGLNLSDVVGYRLPRSAQISEIIRRLNDGIMKKCRHVERCEDFNFDNNTFSFTVVTDLGEEVKIEL